MPTKSKRKGATQKSLTVANGGTNPSSKTIDSYFPRTPLADNNNEVSLEITSETVFYYHGAISDDTKHGNILVESCYLLAFLTCCT